MADAVLTRLLQNAVTVDVKLGQALTSFVMALCFLGFTPAGVSFIAASGLITSIPGVSTVLSTIAAGTAHWAVSLPLGLGFLYNARIACVGVSVKVFAFFANVLFPNAHHLVQRVVATSIVQTSVSGLFPIVVGFSWIFFSFNPFTFAVPICYFVAGGAAFLWNKSHPGLNLGKTKISFFLILGVLIGLAYQYSDEIIARVRGPAHRVKTQSQKTGMYLMLTRFVTAFALSTVTFMSANDAFKVLSRVSAIVHAFSNMQLEKDINGAIFKVFSILDGWDMAKPVDDDGCKTTFEQDLIEAFNLAREQTTTGLGYEGATELSKDLLTEVKGTRYVRQWFVNRFRYTRTWFSKLRVNFSFGLLIRMPLLVVLALSAAGLFMMTVVLFIRYKRSKKPFKRTPKSERTPEMLKVYLPAKQRFMTLWFWTRWCVRALSGIVIVVCMIFGVSRLLRAIFTAIAVGLWELTRYGQWASATLADGFPRAVTHTDLLAVAADTDEIQTEGAERRLTLADYQQVLGPDYNPPDFYARGPMQRLADIKAWMAKTNADWSAVNPLFKKSAHQIVAQGHRSAKKGNGGKRKWTNLLRNHKFINSGGDDWENENDNWLDGIELDRDLQRELDKLWDAGVDESVILSRAYNDNLRDAMMRARDHGETGRDTFLDTSRMLIGRSGGRDVFFDLNRENPKNFMDNVVSMAKSCRLSDGWLDDFKRAARDDRGVEGAVSTQKRFVGSIHTQKRSKQPVAGKPLTIGEADAAAMQRLIKQWNDLYAKMKVTHPVWFKRHSKWKLPLDAAAISHGLRIMRTSARMDDWIDCDKCKVIHSPNGCVQAQDATALQGSIDYDTPTPYDFDIMRQTEEHYLEQVKKLHAATIKNQPCTFFECASTDLKPLFPESMDVPCLHQAILRREDGSVVGQAFGVGNKLILMRHFFPPGEGPFRMQLQVPSLGQTFVLDFDMPKKWIGLSDICWYNLPPQVHFPNWTVAVSTIAPSSDTPDTVMRVGLTHDDSGRVSVSVGQVLSVSEPLVHVSYDSMGGDCMSAVFVLRGGQLQLDGFHEFGNTSPKSNAYVRIPRDIKAILNGAGTKCRLLQTKN